MKQEGFMKHCHRQLEKQGWIRQFVADGPLAKDAVEIYDLLGYEVHLQSTEHAHSKKKDPASSAEFQSHCKVIYIRPKKF
jgi:hypothetical protein